MNVKGHAALVTGGGSGLGAGTAKALAAAGARVAVLDVNMEGAEKVAKEIGGIAIKCDVSNAADGDNAVAAAREKHGIARVLVNCAGIAPAARIVGKEGPLALDAFARVINVNLIGSFNMMRLAASDMAKAEPLADGERGVIVSTASVAAFEGQIGQAAYAASKGGVAAVTFGTPMLLGMPQAVQDSLAAQVPFPSRLGTPAEYAKLVMHILDNVMLNGEVIRLDGAIRMGPK